jgi:hypothetical protein
MRVIPDLISHVQAGIANQFLANSKKLAGNALSLPVH